MRCDGAQGWCWRPSHSSPDKETPPLRHAATRRWVAPAPRPRGISYLTPLLPAIPRIASLLDFPPARQTASWLEASSHTLGILSYPILSFPLPSWFFASMAMRFTGQFSVESVSLPSLMGQQAVRGA